jgi:hypothetical protein
MIAGCPSGVRFMNESKPSGSFERQRARQHAYSPLTQRFGRYAAALVDQARQSTVMRVAAIVPFTSTPVPVEGNVLKVKLPV